MKTLLWMLRIRRIEFRIAELPILIIPILLTIRSTAAVKTWPFWEGVIVFFFLFAFGDMINCLADRDLDAVYKKHLSEAVYGLGTKSVKWQIAVSVLTAFLLSCHVAWRLDRWLIVPMIVVGLILGAAYSVEPVRLKSRGVLGAICLWLIIFVGPMLLSSMLVSSFPSLPVIAIAAAYGLMQMGVTLVNTAEDYPEDIEAGLTTSIISLGLARGIRFASWLAVAGALGTITTLAVLLWTRAGASIWLAGLIPVVAATALVATQITKLASTIAPMSIDDAVAAVKQSAKAVPIWFTINAWSVCLAAWCIYRAGLQ
jgi:4-hydroxybenzoate polyprenyltransferase